MHPILIGTLLVTASVCFSIWNMFGPGRFSDSALYGPQQSYNRQLFAFLGIASGCALVVFGALVELFSAFS